MTRYFLFFCAVSCFAQSVEVGGGYALFRQNVSSDDGYNAAANFGVHVGLSSRVAVGFWGVSGPYENATFLNGQGPYVTRAGFTAALGEVRYSFSASRWTPYVAGGAGVVVLEDITSNAPDAGFVITDLNLRDGQQAAWGFGGGFNAALTKQFGLDLGLRLIKGQHTDLYYTPTIGVCYRFGK